MVRAATEAGCAPSTAARWAAELMRSPKVRPAIHEAMENAGVTGEHLAGVLREGLEATKTITTVRMASQEASKSRIGWCDAAIWN